MKTKTFPEGFIKIFLKLNPQEGYGNWKVPRYLAYMHPLAFYPMSTPETRVGTGFHDQTLAVIYTTRTRGGREKKKNTKKSAYFIKKKLKKKEEKKLKTMVITMVSYALQTPPRVAHASRLCQHIFPLFNLFTFLDE